MRVRCLIAVFVAGLGAVLARSSAAQLPGALVPISTRSYIGINPLGLPVDIGTIEGENAVAPGVTLGGVGSYIDVNHTRFTTFDFKVRYYPGEVVLRGLSVGGSAGYTHFSNVVDGTRQTLSAPTIGIIVDDNRLVGRSEHFLVGTGVGVKRVLASSDERARAGVDRAVFTARLILGVAF